MIMMGISAHRGNPVATSIYDVSNSTDSCDTMLDSNIGSSRFCKSLFNQTAKYQAYYNGNSVCHFQA